MATSLQSSEPARRPALVMLVVGTGTLLTAMASSTTNLALPAIGAELGLSIASVSWIALAFLLPVTVLLLMAGKAGCPLFRPFRF